MSLPWKPRISSMWCLGRAVESYVHFSTPVFYPPSWVFGFTEGTAWSQASLALPLLIFSLVSTSGFVSMLHWAPVAPGLGQMPKSVVFLLFHWVLQSCGNGSHAGALPACSPCPSERRGGGLSSWFPSWAQGPTSPSTQIAFHLQVCLASSCIASVRHGPMFQDTETSLRFSVLIRKEFKDRLRSSRTVYRKTPGQSPCKPWQQKEKRKQSHAFHSQGPRKPACFCNGVWQASVWQKWGWLSLQRIKGKGSDNQRKHIQALVSFQKKGIEGGKRQVS